MLKDEIKHFLFSISAGLIIAVLFHNFWAIIFALLTGFFIDADHLIDYGIYKKFRGFDLKEFFSGKFFDYSGKVYIFFHGFEYALILFFLGIFYKEFQWLYFSLSLSLLFHLLFDTFHNRPRLPTYFISYRIYHRFNHNYFWLKENLNRK